jgi:hypothetical protein
VTRPSNGLARIALAGLVVDHEGDLSAARLPFRSSYERSGDVMPKPANTTSPSPSVVALKRCG